MCDRQTSYHADDSCLSFCWFHSSSDVQRLRSEGQWIPLVELLCQTNSI